MNFLKIESRFKATIMPMNFWFFETEIVPAQYGHLQKILKCLIVERKDMI